MIERKILYKNKWISIRSVADKEKGIKPYYYKHIESSDGNTVGILPYRWRNGKIEIMVIDELRPAWDVANLEQRQYSSITGCVDPNETIMEAAIREFNEETPYHLEEDKLIYVGQSFITKSSDTVIHQFLIEISPHHITYKSEGDGSKMEKTATPTWISLLYVPQVKDPLIAQMVVKLFDYLDMPLMK